MNLITRVRLWIAARLSKKGLFYINGPDVLPAPLSPEREAECIAHIEEETARSTLVEHNLRLVVYIAKRFENTGAGLEDLVSIGTIGLIKGVNTYKRGSGTQLSTYCARCIENPMLSPV